MSIHCVGLAAPTRLAAKHEGLEGLASRRNLSSTLSARLVNRSLSLGLPVPGAERSYGGLTHSILLMHVYRLLNYTGVLWC